MPEETDSLANLEHQIARVVEQVSTLRKHNAELASQLEAARLERDRAIQTRNDLDNALNEAKTVGVELDRLRKEVEELRTERKNIRGRIEKLLGQIDLLEQN